MTRPSASPYRLLWSVCQTHSLHEPAVHQAIEQAAAEGVTGIELPTMAIDLFLRFADQPVLQGAVDAARVAQLEGVLERLSAHCREAGLRLGLWHHELWGPADLLERMPALRAADGLVDLAAPALYQFVTAKVREFFGRFPHVDELVLTLTETHIPVFRRPFCDLPGAQRVRRVLEAVLAATEPAGKLLVVRPFSAVRQDELDVRQALTELTGRRLAVMYKTEPFDWNPFLPHEELIGSLPQFEVRAETDCGAEYYGQSMLPCQYVGHVGQRLEAARQRGAQVFVLRVDRDPRHPAMGHPVNEANLLVPTRWLRDPQTPLLEHLAQWHQQRYGALAPALLKLLPRTFDVICQALYIDQQSISHHRFPRFDHLKHIQVFHLLEENVPLTHMARHWSMLSARTTRTHEWVLTEKDQALTLARDLEAAARLIDAPAEIQTELAKLTALARACAQLLRVLISHVREMWGLEPALTEPFAREAAALRAQADQLEQAQGANFMGEMPAEIRGIAAGLEAERAVEIPLRQQWTAQADVTDYVLCGFAAEGHRLSKMLHSGATPQHGGRPVRQTGVGPEQDVVYTLQRGSATKLEVEVADAAPGMVEVAGMKQALTAPGITTLKLPTDVAPALAVRVYSTRSQPVTLLHLALRR